MHIVLDIDLDAFVSPVCHDAKEHSVERLADGEFITESEEAVIKFLENQLGLSTDAPIAGAFVTHHHEVLPLWEQLCAGGKLQTKFAVLHVDSHDDVWGYEGEERVHCGNYLIHAVRRELLSHIVFIQPKGTLSLPAAYERHKPHRLCFLGHDVRIFLEHKEEFIWRNRMPRGPDFMFLAHSPNFTPESADTLIPVIRKYIKPL